MYTIVLADTIHEANSYARRVGLRRGAFRFPVSAAAIRGLRVAEIHELPSFSRRRDRHAINAELRYSRGQRLLVSADGEPVEGVQVAPTARQLEVAYRYDRLRELEKPQWQRDLDRKLEPEGWEPPESLTALQFLALAGNDDPNKNSADVLAELEETHGEETGTPVEGEDPAPAAPKRRRSRCKDCGDLDFPETHACPVALRAPEATPPVAPPSNDPFWD